MIKIASWLIPVLIAAGMCTLGIVGAICVGTENYDSCFDSQGSAILMATCGYFLCLCFFCIGLYLFPFYETNKRGHWCHTVPSRKETFERL